MNNQRVSNYKASGEEFGRRLLALYKAKFFPRMGKELAENLFRTGLEAGAAVSAMGNISDAESKFRLGTQAIVLLTQTAYTAQVMAQGGYYTQAQVAPLVGYIDKLVAALDKVLGSAPRPTTARNNPVVRRQVVVQQVPVIQRQTVIRTAPSAQNAASPKATPAPAADHRDPDGFDDPVGANR